MEPIEVLVALTNDMNVSYRLGPDTTLTQLKELLKDDDLIEGDEVFQKPEQNSFIPKSQEKVRTIQEFQQGDVAKLQILKKGVSIPKQGVQEALSVSKKAAQEELSAPKQAAQEKPSGLKQEVEEGFSVSKPVAQEEEKVEIPSSSKILVKQKSIDLIDAGDSPDLGPETIRSLLKKCYYLNGWTFSENLKISPGSQSFFEDSANQQFDQGIQQPKNQSWEKKKLFFWKETQELLRQGLFDPSLEDEIMNLNSFKFNKVLPSTEKKEYFYAEIGFPQISFVLSDIRSEVNRAVKDFFQPGETITAEKLRKFLQTFGTMVPEVVTFGGKVFASEEIKQKDFQQEILQKEIRNSLENFFGQDSSIKNSLLLYSGGNPNSSNWKNSLINGFTNWEVISVDCWRWTYEYLEDSFVVQIQQLLQEKHSTLEKSPTGTTQSYPLTSITTIQGNLSNPITTTTTTTTTQSTTQNETFKKHTYPNGDVYEGTWKNNKRHGFGKLMRPDGSLYEGNYHENNRHGFGKYTWPDGGVYEGNWREGKKYGFGKYAWSNGALYEGHWEDDKRHGQGKYKWADGGFYEGSWKESKRHGFGKHKYPNGDTYEGYWEGDKKHGQGKYHWIDGGKYEGSFENDKRHGSGKHEWSDGGVYEGAWKDGQRHGYGKNKFPNGDIYEGNWEYEKKKGQGKYKWTDGGIYVGGWEADQRNGFGKHRWIDGGMYEGDWKDGKRSGSGKHQYPNGDRYEGSWLNDLKHGKGRYRWVNGQVYDGQWNNGNRSS